MAWTRSTLTLCAALLCGTSALAQNQVTLSSDDGVMSISGKLLSFDDEFYTIESSLGTIQVPIALSKCLGSACPEIHPLNQEITVTGAEFILSPLLPDAITQYAGDIEAELTDDGGSKTITNADGDVLARIDVQSAEPADALQTLLNNDATAAILSRRVTAAEVEAFEAEGLGDLRSFERERIIGQDGLLLMVSEDTGVTSLSLPDISGIFSGQFRNWSDFGGADLPIRVLAPPRNSGASEYFFQSVLDPEFGVFADDVEFVTDLASIPEEVKQGSGVIGLTSSTVDDHSLAVGIASACGIVVPPTDFTIKSEDYPLARRMYLYTTSTELPSRAEKLFDLIEGPWADRSLRSAGFTTFAVKETALSNEGNRLAHALANPEQAAERSNLAAFAAETIDARRLSYTFRFAFGSSRLDNKALADIDRLVATLTSEEYRSQDILVIGFSDSTGESEGNRILSERRAQQVLQDIVTASGGRVEEDRIRAFGFGASAPIACNSTEAERQLNRRVEVWVR